MIRNLSTRRSAKGFTLIELLVVTLILSILMAVAIPLYLSSVADSKLKTCRANMQTIANAVQAARVKGPGNGSGPYTDYGFATGAVTTANEPDLITIPTCPSAGTYAIAPGTSTNDGNSFMVTCTATGHGHFEPGVDSH